MDSALPQGLDLSKVPSMIPPPGIQPNLVNPETLADTIIAMSATTSILAIALLSARLYSTLGITRSVGYDDYVCVAGMVFSLAYMGLILNTRDYARHMWDMPLAGYTSRYFKILLSGAIIGALGLLFAKLSILLLLFRLFSPNRRFRYSIYVGIVWATLISLVTVVIATALCSPRKGEAFNNIMVAQRCHHLQSWAVAQGALNVLLDFYILYLPIPVVWKLQLGRNRRVGVLGVFMTGLIACISSVLGAAYKAKLLQSPDLFWNSYVVDILNIVETNVAIMVACMPACASFLRYFLSKAELLSSIKSRIKSRLASLRSKKYSKSKTTNSASPADNTDSGQNRLTASDSDDRPGKRSKGKYWNVKNIFERGDVPPQITSAKRESGHILKSGDFDLFDAKTSSERGGTSLEQEEKRAAAYDVV